MLFTSAQVVPTTGLAGHWKLDDGAGTTAVDSSSGGNTGTLVNGPMWTTGKIGGASNFDGVDDYVSIPEFPGSEGSAITVSAWVKPSSVTDSNAIIAKTRSGFLQWALYMDGTAGGNTTNNLQFSVQNTAGTSVTAASDNGVMADLGWHHVIGVYDGANVYVYLDGVSVDSAPPALTGAIDAHAHNICIGTSGASCNETAGLFGGVIDDVRIYNRALSTQEIQDLYNSTGSITITADATAPSVPAGLSATAVSSSQINLAWSASTDNVSVTGYDIYRGGTLLTTVTTTSYSNTGLTASTAYSYTVRAKDVAGNASVQLASVSATTQAVPVCTTFTYSAWNTCQSNGTQSRITTSTSPQSCMGGTPILTQSCIYTPPTTATTSTPTICTTFTYSAWNTCQSNGTQSRTADTASPQGCTEGTPVLSQSCTYTPPVTSGGTVSSGGTTSSGGTSGGTASSGGTTFSGSSGGGTLGIISSGTMGATAGTSPLSPVFGPFSIGTSNDEVKKLQQMLIRDGIFKEEAAGNYGPSTQKAVEQFQTKHSLAIIGTPNTTGYGLAGPATRAKLNALYAKSAGTTATFTRPISLGTNNSEVKKLQQFLTQLGLFSASATGYYGPLTVKSVQLFQSRYNLVTSGTPESTGYGFVGPKTRAKLNALYGGVE